MDKKTLILALIAYYECAIKRLDFITFSGALKFVHNRDLQLGVCYASLNVFGVDIYNEEWTKQYNAPFCSHWGHTPDTAEDTKQLIEYLQVRVNNLKKELDHVLYGINELQETQGISTETR